MALTGLTGLFKSVKSSRDFGAMAPKEYPTDADSYELLEDCGRGVSATVHKVLCKPLNEIMAVKKMNLESVGSSLDDIIQETSTMRNYHHPNVLPLYTSFVDKNDLWMVMPLISGGSVLHIMKYSHPDGLDEISIATIMRDVLKALDYVHRQGGIHRDIKAGNILVDKDGRVYLADFGVSTSLERGASWGNDKKTRMTFVGTPCWMAPEVMEQTAGYDNAADIWSFGITLLELAHGHAPFAKFSPMKVLLMTLQNPPPTLDDQGRKVFSKSMKDLVTRCLQKDPRIRPTAAQLLEHKFFKIAKDEDYLQKHLLAGLPPLGERVQEIRQGKGKAATFAQDNAVNIALSVEEYKKGVSSWNFDVAALKAQAEMEPDDGVPSLSTIAETEEEPKQGSMQPPPTPTPSLGLPQQPGGASPGSTPTKPSSAFAVSSSQHSLAGILDGAAELGPSPVQSGAPASLPPGANISPMTSTEAQGQTTGRVIISPSGSSAIAPQDSFAGTTTRKGRFQIYGSGDEPPPMSAPANLVLKEAEAVCSASALSAASAPAPAQPVQAAPAAPPAAAAPAGVAMVVQQPAPHSGANATPRPSVDFYRSDAPAPTPRLQSEGSNGLPDDGTSLGPVLNQQASLSTVSMEPKKKGRFMIIENAGGALSMDSSGMMAKVPSVPARLSESGAGPSGKPPTHPFGGPAAAASGSSNAVFGAPSSSSASVPVQVFLPKLFEILEQNAAQQSALHKLVAMSTEWETNPSIRSSLTAQAKSIVTPAHPSRLGGPPSEGVSSTEELLSLDADSLRARLNAVEAENQSLRLRNTFLEGLFEQPPMSRASQEGVTQPASVPASE